VVRRKPVCGILVRRKPVCGMPVRRKPVCGMPVRRKHELNVKYQWSSTLEMSTV
jgi:hypothetical protein